MATQLQIYSICLSPFFFIWTLMYFDVLPTYYNKKIMLVGMPLSFLAVFCLYAAFLLVYGVLTFNDCSEAREELICEIIEAKEDLRRRKIIE